MRTRRSGLLVLAAFFFLGALEAADRSVEPIVSRIPRAAVDSSALTSIGYSRKLRALEIEFHDGSIYRYLAVPRSLHQELLTAPSKARFYNRHLRGKYRCLRVQRPRPR